MGREKETDVELSFLERVLKETGEFEVVERGHRFDASHPNFQEAVNLLF